ncbi:hypothetical protein Lal_00038464 [Lupinus albus]|nr:hypothetical protein Lal_00038464 [Lupinus albus]
MTTLNQLIRHGREEKRRTDRTRASDQCPQKLGVGPRLSTRTPKKPNSAPRKIAILVFLLLIVFAVTYLVCILLGLDWTIFVVKVQSMLLVRSFRLLFLRLAPLIGEAVAWEAIPITTWKIQQSDSDSDSDSEEERVEAGPVPRSAGGISISTFPKTNSGDELSDLVAELDQVEREIRRLSESRIESTEGLEARQTKLARLKTVLDGVESRLDQAREIDRVRDNERARLREEMDYDYHRWGTLEQENARIRFKVNELTLNKRSCTTTLTAQAWAGPTSIPRGAV